jgi:hypothetical protein
MDEETRLRSNSREQHDLLPSLFDYSLINQQYCRQVGGRPPTSLTQSPSELLDPFSHRNI